MAIGHALHDWSQVENSVSELFVELSGMEPKNAHIVMSAIVAFEARLSVCTEMLKLEPNFAEDLPVWEKLHIKIRKAYKSRHQIAHFSFMESHLDGSVTVSLQPMFSIGRVFQGKQTSIGLSEIKDKSVRFKELQQAVLWYWMKAVMRKIPGSTLQPPPNLIRRIRTAIDHTPTNNSGQVE